MSDSFIFQAVLEPELTLEVTVRILGFGLMAGVTAAVAAIVFRWYSGDDIPDGVAALLGVTPVALWLNTQTALQDAIIGTTPLLDARTATFTIAAFAASAIAADGGRRAGDYLANTTLTVRTPQRIDDVGQLVRSAGRVVSIDLPEEIADVDGYDPVDDAIKAELAGQSFLFPRRLSTERLRERLVDRLERDYGIGHVDVELSPEGEVTYLGVGSRPAGIGPTLAPGTVGVAVTADPAPDATPGDAIRLWRQTDDSIERLAEGELRGVADDVATLAIDAEDATALSPTDSYRLVTLPSDQGAERDVVSLLRAAEETVTTLTIDDESPLAGTRVDAVAVLVLAIERPNPATASEVESECHTGPVIAFPGPEATFAVGDTVYVLGRPEVIRRLADRSPATDER